MRAEPPVKRATVFVDGQNLFHAARAAFDRTYPDYDVHALGRAICASNGWTPSEIRFYTGLPEPADSARWHRFWMAKLAAMGRQGVYVVSRPLRYRNQTVRLPDGTEHTVLVGEEKGIDVRIALDVIRLAHRREYDVAVVLSQDQDLAEVAEEIRVIAREQDRWIKIARCTTPAWIGATTARVDAVVAVGIACPCVTGAGTGARRLAILGAEGTQRPGIAQARAWRGLDLDRHELAAGLDDEVHTPRP